MTDNPMIAALGGHLNLAEDCTPESEEVLYWFDGPLIYALDRPCGKVLCIEHSGYGEAEFEGHQDVTEFLCALTSEWALERLKAGMVSIFETIRGGSTFQVFVDKEMQILSAESWDYPDELMPEPNTLLYSTMKPLTYLAEASDFDSVFASASRESLDEALEALREDTDHITRPYKVTVYREIYRES